jgi:hypothetical protein
MNKEKEVLRNDILYFCGNGYLKNLSLNELHQIYNILINKRKEVLI